MKKILLTFFYIVAILLVDQASAWKAYAGNDKHKEPENDSIIAPASYRYGRLTPIKWFFMGTNYRKDWCTPVKMPIFHLNTTKGGFTIKELGGGQQTKSLKLKDKKGKEWVLRTIDKDVTKGALPKKIRNVRFVRAIIQDQISAAYPYAPLTLTDISHAVQVPVTPNELYYVPDDPALGKYRKVLAHRVCLLEPEPEVLFSAGSVNTDKAYKAIRADNRSVVVQQAVLRARLLDMLIADWDRHKNQWDWTTIDSNNIRYYYPIPEDRDQAYFLTNGMLAKIIRLFALPNLIGFTHSGEDLQKLNYKVYSFDRYFMNQLQKQDWIQTIKVFQANLSDEVIRNAVKKLPPEIYALRGVEIQNKLLKRRDHLLENAMLYYEFLMSEAIVNGTSMAERYEVKYNGDKLLVEVARKSDGVKMFSRTYDAGETSEVAFWDFSKNNDEVTVTGEPNRIKLSWQEPKPIDKESNKF